MQIKEKEVAYRKEVGTLDGLPVVQLGLKGGLHLFFAIKGKGIETLGAGSHPAVAKHLAKKKSKDKIVWTELSKSEDLPIEHYQHLLPHAEILTQQFQAFDEMISEYFMKAKDA